MLVQNSSREKGKRPHLRKPVRIAMGVVASFHAAMANLTKRLTWTLLALHEQSVKCGDRCTPPANTLELEIGSRHVPNLLLHGGKGYVHSRVNLLPSASRRKPYLLFFKNIAPMTTRHERSLRFACCVDAGRGPQLSIPSCS